MAHGVVDNRGQQDQQLFTLYRFYADDDTLLYVGLTINPGRRFVKHSYDKPWWGDVARIDMEQLPSLEELRAAERTAIQTERPLHNIRMNRRAPEKTEPPQGKRWERTPEQHELARRVEKAWAADNLQISGIVGRWFHSYRPLESDEQPSPYSTVKGNCIREWQGQIIGRDGDLFIAQLYSWWDGCPSNEVVVEVEDMKPWRFFATNELMVTADGCGEDFGDWKCTAPCTHVIRNFAGYTNIFRCEEHIQHYSGKPVRL